MKVNYQENFNECGACVLKSIYEYIYKKPIEKSNIVSNYFFKKDGMSLYDFEILANAIDIKIESYEVDYNQLINLKINQYFVTIFNNENLNSKHYVICKKLNNKFKIIDSVNGEYFLSFEEFKKYYDNIFIVFFKSKLFSDLDSKFLDKKIKFFEIQNQTIFLLLNLFLDLLILFISLVGSSLIKITINFINEGYFSDWIYLAIYFLLVFSCELLFSYWFSLYKSYKMQNILNQNMVFYINYLSNKTLLFYKNNENGKLFKYAESIGKFLTYKYIETPSIYSDIVFFIFLVFLLSYLSFYYLIIALIFSSVNLFISYFENSYNRMKFNQNLELKNEVDHKLFNLYNFLKTEKNKNKLNNIVSDCNKSIFKMGKLNLENISFFSKTEFIKSLIKKTILVLFISISSFWIMTNNKKYIDNISQLVFAISLISFFDNSMASIFNFFSNYPNYKNSKKILDDFLVSYNKKENNKNGMKIQYFEKIVLDNLNFNYQNNLEIFKNKKIELFNNTLVFGKNGVGKTTMLRILSLDLPLDSNSIYKINNIDINSYDLNDIENKIFYLSNKNTPLEINYINLFKKEKLKKDLALFLEKTNLGRKKINEMSLGEVQICNLLELLNLKNCLILLDEAFSNLSSENLNFFMEKFYPHIIENNFVVVVTHDLNLKKYFKNVINISENES